MYDTKDLVKDPSGRIKTGEYSDVDASSMNNDGYQQALTYAQKSTPLSTISTSGAAETMNKHLDKLNQLSPHTAPGYVPPVTDLSKKDTSTATAIPKAFFSNEVGQEAEYTQDQLNDPTNQKFLKENGYVMTRTEGPTGLQGEVNTLDTKIADLADRIMSYSPDTDPNFAPIVSSISSSYNMLRNQVLKNQAADEKMLNTIGLRTGINRYAPGQAVTSHMNLLNDYTDKLAELTTKESTSITEARTAYASGKFTQFTNAMNALEKVRDDKADTLKDINKTISDALVASKKAERESTRDSAIAGLVEQGITDPSEILDAMNNYEDGTPTGGNFTAKEIEDTLKSLSPDGKLDKLTGETKNFYILKQTNQLPGNISSLPESQQLFAYLKAQKASETAPKGDTFTLSEIISARKNGADIPLSLAGMSQDEFTDSLSADVAPEWFLEKLLSSQLEIDPKLARQLTPTSPVVQRAWDEYKASLTSDLGSEAGGP